MSDPLIASVVDDAVGCHVQCRDRFLKGFDCIGDRILGAAGLDLLCESFQESDLN